MSNTNKIEIKKCLRCGEQKARRHYFVSFSPLHKLDGLIPFCKTCLGEMCDPNDLDSVKEVLRQIDRPFLRELWDKAVEEAEQDNKDVFGLYMRNIALGSARRALTWADSNDISNHKSRTIEKLEEQAEEIVRQEELTQQDIFNLEDKWGFGYTPQELVYFERKYSSLIGNYPNKTSLHVEALRAYCVYKVRAEIETARGNAKDAKTWAELAQKQGEIAKINVNKLDKSDLSQGLDSFSELVRMVEKEVDIIPILPHFVERPQDKVDLAIYSFINYERRLHGLPDVEYSDVYDFYQDNLREYMNDDTKSADIKRHMIEIEIESKNPETNLKKK